MATGVTPDVGTGVPGGVGCTAFVVMRSETVPVCVRATTTPVMVENAGEMQVTADIIGTGIEVGREIQRLTLNHPQESPDTAGTQTRDTTRITVIMRTK